MLQDTWGLCCWVEDIEVVEKNGREFYYQDYSMIMTKKLFDMVHMIEYLTDETLYGHDGQVTIEFECTFSPATSLEIYILKKFRRVFGGAEFIENILKQNKESKGKEWFDTAYKELQKSISYSGTINTNLGVHT